MRTGCWLGASLLSFVIGCTGSAGTDGERLGSHEQGILGGERATYADLRGTVALVLSSNGFPFCSGTLVAPDVVVTAAHCAIEFDPETGEITGERNPDEILVIAGETSMADATPEDAYELAAVDIHPLYLRGPVEDPSEQFGGLHDIAVLSLRRNVERMTPVALLDDAAARDRLTLGSELVIGGFGASDSQGSEGGGILREAEVPVVRVGRDEFIAGEPGTPDTCPGDSGGPVYLERDGVLALVGVTSRGLVSSTQPCGQGGIYTLVAAHLDFVDFASPSPITKISDEAPGDEDSGDDEDIVVDEDDGSDEAGEDDAGDGDVASDDDVGAEPETSTSTDAITAAGPTTGGCQSYPFSPAGGPGMAMLLGMVAFVLRRRG